MGYTCGLWQLFHVASVGVVEYNRNTNCEGADESDEDSFDLDDGFCSVNDDESLFDESVVINDKLATTATVI